MSAHRKDIIGLLLSKELVLVDPANTVYVRDIPLRDLPRLSADTPMYDMLQVRLGCESVCMRL